MVEKLAGELPCVYMIYRENDKGSTIPIKIGITTNIRERVVRLSTGSDSNIRVMSLLPCESIKGARIIEKNLHKMFEQFRMRGEWFSLEKEKCKYLFLNLADEIKKGSSKKVYEYQTMIANLTAMVDHL